MHSQEGVQEQEITGFGIRHASSQNWKSIELKRTEVSLLLTRQSQSLNTKLSGSSLGANRNGWTRQNSECRCLAREVDCRLFAVGRAVTTAHSEFLRTSGMGGMRLSQAQSHMLGMFTSKCFFSLVTFFLNPCIPA